MAEIHALDAFHKAQGSTSRQPSTGSSRVRPHIKAELFDTCGELIGTRTVTGRVAWTLDQLIKAGEGGCTPFDNPAPRWSDYVFKLRRDGFNVETRDEAHGGPYSGTHARYVLVSPVRVIETSFATGSAA